MGQCCLMDIPEGNRCTSGHNMAGLPFSLHLIILVWLCYFILIFLHSSLTFPFNSMFMKMQLSSVLITVQKKNPHSHILANTHVPGKASWDHAVNRALQIISRNDPVLIKVVNRLCFLITYALHL